MDRQPFLQDFQQRLLDLLRASPAADLERNLKAFVGQTFNKLELVTRDEFDVQRDLLRALASRVEALEVTSLREGTKATTPEDTGHDSGAQGGRHGESAHGGHPHTGSSRSADTSGGKGSHPADPAGGGSPASAKSTPAADSGKGFYPGVGGDPAPGSRD